MGVTKLRQLRRVGREKRGLGLACLAVSAVAIAALWGWLGAAVPMPQASLAPSEKLYCLSYSPFRSGQSPFDPKLQITPEQIDEDLTQLAHITDCVRTYSVELGQDQVASIARRHGLKVIQGMWLGTKPDKNRAEIDTAVKIANQYPDVVRALVVGNEVLLRGDMAVEDLDHTIRAVKARVQVPVTYADVWDSGCATRKWPRRRISSPFTFCPIGTIS